MSERPALTPAFAPSPSFARLVQAADLWLGRIVEGLAAALIVFEVCLLFSGVVARYAFHHPIVWSDELAGSVFLWLGMLGAVIALRRGEHLAFNALAKRVSPSAQVFLQALVMACVVAMLCLLLKPAIEYVQDEQFAVMPNLGVPAGWRVFGIALGVFLMLLTGIVKAWNVGLKPMLLGAAAILLVGAALWALGPTLTKIGNFNLIVFFVLIVGAAILIGVPIGFAFATATLSYLAFTTSTPLNVIVNRLDQGMSQPLLIAIPMFIFLGLLIEVTGFARMIIAFLAALMGFIRGGLYYVLLVAMILVSGISGSKVADMAAVAPGLFPEMRRRGAKDGDLVALLACSAAMADTIPPSIVLITLGSVTGISIASLFTAGVIPALVLAVALALMIFVRSRSSAPPAEDARPNWAHIYKSFVAAIPAISLPFVIRWAVVEGVATATEVSTVGIVYALLVGILLYRPVQWSRFYPVLIETASLSGAILFVIGTATGVAWSLTQSGFSSSLATTMHALSGGPMGFLVITIVVFILLGNILEGIPALLLFAPLLLPVSHSFGIHDLHYAMVVVIAMSIGLFAPPFGIGFYAACAIGKVSPDDAIGHVWRYLTILIIALAVVAAVPWFSIVLL
jgi:tripartite ATP-independent transporter DctM subunit